jgi:hypothetical protein
LFVAQKRREQSGGAEAAEVAAGEVAKWNALKVPQL